MDNSKRELIYHIIDWSIAILAMVISIVKEKMIYIVGILFMASLVSFIIVLCGKIRRISKLEKELGKYKLRLETYEDLLNSPYPLYGLVNYISKNTDEAYYNEDIKLDSLSLEVNLVNEITPKKHNDLQFIWEFKGRNLSEKNVDKLYLRIGGDSSTEYDDLGISAIVCIENDIECSERCKKFNPQKCQKKNQMNVEDIKEYSTKTFHLLKLEFTEPIKQYKMFKTKVRYVWPQCFNANFDFLLIDPKNFADKIENLYVRVFEDERVITKQSVIFLHSIYLKTNEHLNEGRFEYSAEEKCFIRSLQDVNNDKIYYVKIKNN